MNARLLLIAGTLVTSGAWLAGCDEGLSTLAGPTPTLQPTFSSIQQNIFEATDSTGRIACTGCHTDQGRNPSGGLNLRHDVAHASLLNAISTAKPGAVRVMPGDPDGSYLIHKLEGRTDITGLRMPRPTGPYLSEGQMLIIRRWIERGAPND
jgi:hypothetical protein